MKKVYDALDLKVTLTGAGEAEVHINLPLDIGLETIVSDPTSTPRDGLHLELAFRSALIVRAPGRNTGARSA